MSWGTVNTSPNHDFADRLQTLHTSVNELITKFDPDIVAVEELFFCKNVKTAIRVGQARGVIILAVSHCEAVTVEYSPLKIKKTITGNGNADKKAVQKMVQKELGMPGIPEPDDAADALAIAYCHQVLARFQDQIPAN